MRESRTATATDIDRAAAWKFFAEGQQLTDQRTADSLRKAAERFERALPLWRKVGDQSGEAETLQELAGLYNNAGDNEKALKYLADALRLFQSASDPRGEALALTDTGSILSDLGDNEKALEHFRKLWEMNPDYTPAYFQAGMMLAKSGETETAREVLSQGVQAALRTNDLHAKNEIESALAEL